jgi:hypothetical protein
VSGGPGPSGLEPGTYFFAVLQPGGQPNPNDGRPENLSDQDAGALVGGSNAAPDGSARPSGDSYLKPRVHGRREKV